MQCRIGGTNMAKKDNKNNLTVIDGKHSEVIKTALEAKKTVEELFPGKWTPVQEILQEIQAVNQVREALKEKPQSLVEQIKILKEEIKERYEDKNLQKVLIESIPNYNRIRQWVKTKAWKAAVLEKIREDDVFDNVNKTMVFKAVLDKACKGDHNSAKLYFQLSGELDKETEKSKDDVLDTYADLQKALHRK